MKIELVENPGEADVAAIYEGLRAFNIPHFPGLSEQSFGFFLRDETDNLVGGATGVVVLSIMQIRFVWLAETIRGQGFGTSIMQALDLEARKRGLDSIALETYSFQAPAFYEKFGFKEVGRYMNYPRSGIHKIFYQKNIHNHEIQRNEFAAGPGSA